MKLKSFFNFKNLNYLNRLLFINKSLVNSNFIIFSSLNKAKDFHFLNLKNEVKKLNCKTFSLNPNLIKKVKNQSDLNFLGNHILVILASNFEILCKLIKLLNNEGIWFFFLHNQNLSRIINFNIFEKFSKNFNQLFNFNFLVYRLIIRIFLILALFIRSISLLITYTKI